MLQRITLNMTGKDLLMELDIRNKDSITKVWEMNPFKGPTYET